MPAIKGDMYITHCNYSQPASIKLDNKNIGGHLTPLQIVYIDTYSNSTILIVQLSDGGANGGPLICQGAAVPPDPPRGAATG